MTFDEFVSGKSVAVVGNSQSLFNKNYGSLIDRHDVVIRFNKPANLYCDEYLDTHGEKMDVWAFWAVGAFYHRVLNREKDIDKIKDAFYNNTDIFKIQAAVNSYNQLTSKYINDTYSSKNSNRLVALNRRIVGCSKYQNNEQKKEERDILIQSKINASRIQSSIGTVVLSWLLETPVREVNIFGMDFKVSPTFSEIERHKKDMFGKIDIRCKHNFALEELYVKSRIISESRFKLKV